MKELARTPRFFKDSTPRTAAIRVADEPLPGESRENKAETLTEWPFPFNLEEQGD